MNDLTQPRPPKLEQEPAPPLEPAVEAAVRLDHPRCPFCHEAVRSDDVKAACDACMAWQHEDCWIENQSRCSACGHGEAVGRLELTSAIPPKPADGCRQPGCRSRHLEGARWCELHGRWHVRLAGAVAMLITLGVPALYVWVTLSGLEMAESIFLLLLPALVLWPSVIHTALTLRRHDGAAREGPSSQDSRAGAKASERVGADGETGSKPVLGRLFGG